MSRSRMAAFLAGAGIMTLEILGARWLAPAFGFTLTTWALLISVTLLAGSGGAFLGGVLSGRPRPPVSLCFLVAGVWLVACGLLAPSLVDGLLGLPILAGTLVATLAIVFPAVAALGAVLPMLAAAERGSRGLGRTVGGLVAASTLGSLVGTLGTALVLVPGPGLRASAIGAGAVLAAAAVLLAGGAATRIAGGALVVASLGVSVLGEGRGDPDRIAREGPYGLVEVVRSADGISLLVNGISQGTVNPAATGRGALLAGRQWVELLPYLRPGGRTALHVGLGPGLVPRILETYGIEVRSVEIDPVLVAAARESFGFDGPVTIGDGRAVLRRDDGRYDFLILDAFQGEALPAHLVTREAFAEARARMEPRGVLCLHLIARPDHAEASAVARTLLSEFAGIRCLLSRAGAGLQDLFLFASDGPLVVPPSPEILAAGFSERFDFRPDLDAAPVLTDDRNPLDLLAEPLARELRRASRPR